MTANAAPHLLVSAAKSRWDLYRGPTADDSAVTGFWLSLAAGVLAIAVISPELDAATLAVVLALVAACVGTFAPRPALLRRFGVLAAKRLLMALLIIESAFNALQSLAVHPAQTALWLGLGFVAILILWVPPRRALALFAAVVIGYAIVAGITLAVRPTPFIDVHQFQQEGSAALLAGQNPYALRYFNIYGPETPYYAPEVIDGERLTFGFPYLPASLLLAVPGYALGGDYRWAALAAVILAGILIAATRRNGLAMGAAMAFMIAPTTQEVLWRGWSEPFAAVTLAALVWLAGRSAIGAAIALGLFVAMKQYLAPALLIGPVLLADIRRRLGIGAMTGTALAVAVAATLPFVLWDADSFIYSTVTFHGLQPFRDDGLSLPAIAARNGLPYTESGLPGLVAGALATIFVLFRSPRTVTGFCAGLVVFLLAFFLFGKQAFMNYYFLAMVAAACGVGALALHDDAEGDPAAQLAQRSSAAS